jgi:ADP-ribose pyrophosphatase YjhB (NUDIX family)
MAVPAQPTPPAGPHLSVLAVMLRDGAGGPRVLLLRRANPPQPGHWGFPGGKVEWGEDVGRAALRELREETGVEGANPVAFDSVDLIVPDLTDRHTGAAYHHLMIAVRLDWRSGTPAAGDDALEAHWVPLSDLPSPLCADVAVVAARAVALTA